MNAPVSVPDYRLYRERSGEAADFWLHCEPIPDRTRLHRYEIAAHRHPALFQMFDVTAGGGDIFDGERWQPFAAPCVLFIPPGAVHGFRFARDIDGSVVTALADRLRPLAAADGLIDLFAGAIRVVPREASPGDVIASIATEMSAAAPARNVALEALVSLAVVRIARAWADLTGHVAAISGDPRLHTLRTLLAAHARDGQPLAFYAERLGMSGAHLNRLARRATGLTVQALAERTLLDAARRELVFTPTSVAHVAETLGFGDPAYFNRFFRKHTGTTPGAFRETERARLAEPAAPSALRPTSPPS